MDLKAKVRYATSAVRLISRHYDQVLPVREAALAALEALIAEEREHMAEEDARRTQAKIEELRDAP